MFKPLSMGTNKMLGQDSYVPITQNNFEIRLYGIDGSSATEFADVLTLSTNEIGEIKEEQDTIVVHYGNGIIKFPSKVTFADVDWTLNCFCEPGVYDALRAWRKKVYDPDTELMGLPSQYFCTAYFIRYDGQGNVRDVIKCPGVWPGAVGNGNYNQEGGLVQVSVSLKISKAIYLTKDEISGM